MIDKPIDLTSNVMSKLSVKTSVLRYPVENWCRSSYYSYVRRHMGYMCRLDHGWVAEVMNLRCKVVYMSCCVSVAFMDFRLFMILLCLREMMLLLCV